MPYVIQIPDALIRIDTHEVYYPNDAFRELVVKAFGKEPYTSTGGRMVWPGLSMRIVYQSPTSRHYRWNASSPEKRLWLMLNQPADAIIVEDTP